MLHLGDPLVLPHTAELKERFEGLEVLACLLIDGELTGAVCGHWRIGPHDVEDIVLTLPVRNACGANAKSWRRWAASTTLLATAFCGTPARVWMIDFLGIAGAGSANSRNAPGRLERVLIEGKGNVSGTREGCP